MIDLIYFIPFYFSPINKYERCYKDYDYEYYILIVIMILIIGIHISFSCDSKLLYLLIYLNIFFL